MTVISRTATELVTDVHVLHYLYKGEDRRSWHDTAEDAQAMAANLETYGPDWQPRHVTVERTTYRVGDKVEVSAFGRMRQAVVVGIGRTLVKLEVTKNAQGGKHTGTYQPRYVTNLDRQPVDVTPAPVLTVTPEAEAKLEELAALAAAASVPAEAPAALDREVKLTGRDSTDQADLYLDGRLVLPALTRAERDDLFHQLARLDAAVSHPYDVQELTGLELPHAMAMVHNATVGHLALWHDGAPMAEWELDRRLTTAQVRERAVELAAEVSARVREGLL